MLGDMPMPMTTSSMDNMGDMDIMAMTFWGKNAVVLFRGWPGHSLGMYILSLFFVFVLSFGIGIFLFQNAKPSLVADVLAQTGVHPLKKVLAYLVMLAVMSFNLGILTAVVVGHALGVFIVNIRAMSAASRTEPPVETVSNV